MTKAQIIHDFMNSFGITAYPVNNVPKDVIFPYLTYENSISNNGNSTNPRVVLWDHSESEAKINLKADQIAKRIGTGIALPCDDGAIYVYFDAGWMPIADENDSSINGRYTNLTMVFNTF